MKTPHRYSSVRLPILFLLAVLSLSRTVHPAACAGETAAGRVGFIADLSGRPVGILVGTMLDTAAAKHIDLMIPRYYDEYGQMEAALRSGEIDAIIGDEPVMRDRARRSPGQFRVLEEAVEESVYCFAFRADGGALRTLTDAALRAFREDGTLDTLQASWLGPEPPGEVPALSQTASGKPLVLATSCELPPFTFLSEHGLPCGMDIHLADLIAARLDRPLAVRVMEFGELIPCLAAGEADFIGGAFTRTAERERSLLLSEGYIRIAVAALVRE